MTLTTYADMEQGSNEWLAARCGLVTASAIGRLLTPTLRVAENDMSRAVTLSLVAERITGRVDQTHVTPDMWRGVEDEPVARDLYREHHAPVDEVGFMVRDDWGYQLGYSPDGLVGDEGLIEIKSRLQKNQVQTILEDRVPAVNMAQLQAGLIVSGRAWIDYVSYCGGLPLYVKRVYPDPKWQEAILAAVEAFEARAAAMVLRYRASIEGMPTTERVDRDAEIEF